MPSNDIAIKVDNVSKDFKLPHEKNTTIKSAFVNVLKGKRSQTIEVQHALKHISFEIKKGEFFGIVGRNGSGKSTLLKMLAGIYQPTNGTISVSGKLVPFIELGVGFNPELTGRENVYLNGALLGFSEDEVRQMYGEIVEFAELHDFMDQKLKNYSSGMQVRLAFSMAVRAEADILLIDEVLAVGDTNFQKKCFNYFETLKREKQTVVFVTHDMSAIERFCDRALILDEGRIACQGDTSKITKIYSDLNVTAQSKNIKEKSQHSDSDVTVKGYMSVAGERTKTVKAEDKALKLVFDITSRVEIIRALFGVTIMNGSGTPIFATNTKISDQEATVNANTPLRVEIEVDNIFANGEYTVAFSIKNHEQTEIFFAELDTIRFLSGGRKHDFALTNPGYKVFIK